MKKNFNDELLKIAKGKIIFQEPLKKHTTFKIGGSAGIWFEPKNKADLIKVLRFAKKKKIKTFTIGAGSNLLVKEKGFDGMVISLSSPFFTRINSTGVLLEAGAGAHISKIIQYCLKNSLSGFEFLSGMPGTVGGSISVNVGTHSPEDFSEMHSIAELLRSIEILDDKDRVKKVSARNIKFSYKKSSLKNVIILSAVFDLEKSNKREINRQIHKYLDYRKKTQDYGHPSAGCIFKNPRGVSAGFLIDACGLKGEKSGKAMVSKRHANFIINLGQAKAKSVLKLIKIAQKEVKNDFGIDLETEIEILGENNGDE